MSEFAVFVGADLGVAVAEDLSGEVEVEWCGGFEFYFVGEQFGGFSFFGVAGVFGCYIMLLGMSFSTSTTSSHFPSSFPCFLCTPISV